jgi:hypothetical protein
MGDSRENLLAQTERVGEAAATLLSRVPALTRRNSVDRACQERHPLTSSDRAAEFLVPFRDDLYHMKKTGLVDSSGHGRGALWVVRKAGKWAGEQAGTRCQIGWNGRTISAETGSAIPTRRTAPRDLSCHASLLG